MYADSIMVAESQPETGRSATGSTKPTGPRRAAQNPVVSLATHRVVGLVERWATHLKTARARRKTIAHLSTLDDRLLADIGIERNQIGTAVEGLLRSAETDTTAEASAAHRITNGTGPLAVNDNASVVEDNFEAVARQWRERRPA